MGLQKSTHPTRQAGNPCFFYPNRPRQLRQKKEPHPNAVILSEVTVGAESKAYP